VRPETNKGWWVLILLAAGVVLVAGWRLFWFLTDDAFILFRYVSNSRLGYGYVWNAPPFLPVEGYTSLLWVMSLDAVWGAFGMSPPAAANVLTLVFSLLSLPVIAAMIRRMELRAEWKPYRWLLLLLALLGTVTNRTFLAWSSSGLETALFNWLLLCWLYLALFSRPMHTRWGWTLSIVSAGIYLTRPDGLLFGAATCMLLVLANLGNRPHRHWRRWTAWIPLLTIPLHLVWRRHIYGFWLPNTFYAKYTTPWPESGLRYALSFILEYALWFLIALAVWVLVRRVAGSLRSTEGREPRGIPARAVEVTALGALAAHLGYYTLMVGGDHFEYRVYSYMIPLAFVSCTWLCKTAFRRPRTALAVLVAFVALSYPVPWTHWAVTRHLDTREDTYFMKAPVAPHWPPFFRAYARAFDHLQFWLIDRLVCVRHQEHKVCWQWQMERFPSRSEGMRLSSDGYPIMVVYGAGVPGWVLPHIFIIDYWGLNDPVVARHHKPRGEIRKMAHEREPPKGYMDWLAPNVVLQGPKDVEILSRDKPLTAEAIRNCQREWMARARRFPGNRL
jgi:arabinofuranosyltransferase